jgi:hypothetical protein
MREQCDVKYILRFNRYYIFWEDYGQPYDERAAADREFVRFKTENPSYWNWKIVQRETIIRETDLE